MNRLWLGDGYVSVGDTLQLTGGYTGSATVVAIGPIRGIAPGALLIDPRSLLLVQCAGCDLSGAEYFISYPDSPHDGCAMPDEVFPVIELNPAHLPGYDTDRRNRTWDGHGGLTDERLRPAVTRWTPIRAAHGSSPSWPAPRRCRARRSPNTSGRRPGCRP